MKLQIDTTEKTIQVEEHIKLGDFIATLDDLFPHYAWKEYHLKVNVSTNPINGNGTFMNDPWFNPISGKIYTGTPVI